MQYAPERFLTDAHRVAHQRLAFLRNRQMQPGFRSQRMQLILTDKADGQMTARIAQFFNRPVGFCNFNNHIEFHSFGRR